MRSIEKLSYPSSEVFSSRSRITLLLRSQAPFSPEAISDENFQTINQASVIAASSGRTCYSSSPHTPLDYLTENDKYRQKSDQIAKSTREAGHLTTREHVSYTFCLENVSRAAISYLHSHPHYNSEEESQRYVNLKSAIPIYPHHEDPFIAQDVKSLSENLKNAYTILQEMLHTSTLTELKNRFPYKNTDSLRQEAQKKAQEVARYLLPLGMPTNLYHTISENTLLRLHHLSKTLPLSDELSQIIAGMVEVVTKVDPSITKELQKPLNPPQNLPLQNRNQAESNLTLNLHTPLSTQISRAVRSILSQSESDLTDSDALDLVLNPNQNKLLSQMGGEITLDHLSQALNQAYFSVDLSLSHTANYQLQRHRKLNHTTPYLVPLPQSTKDFVIPALIASSQTALDFYIHTLNTHTQKLQSLADCGVSLESLQYLLPNAVRIQKTVSGPFGAWYHFLKTRNCFNAQEEINQISLQITGLLSELDPPLGNYLNRLVPCSIRKDTTQTPYCPEGSRFCGVSVWKVNIESLNRGLI